MVSKPVIYPPPGLHRKAQGSVLPSELASHEHPVVEVQVLQRDAGCPSDMGLTVTSAAAALVLGGGCPSQDLQSCVWAFMLSPLAQR